MSDILIRKENISRFNKRLQKSLKEHFKQEVPLNIAADIFAQSLGLKNAFEVYTLLDKSESTSHERLAQEFIDEVKNYFKGSTQFKSCEFVDYGDSMCIQFTAKNKTQLDTVGLYFNTYPLQDAMKYFNALEISVEDKKFVEHLCTHYFKKEKEENKFLAEKIKKVLNIEGTDGEDCYSFYREKIFKTLKIEGAELYGSGLFKEYFLVAPNDFIERAAFSYALDGSTWCYIDNSDFPEDYQKKFRMYGSFKEALKNKKSDEMIFQSCESLEFSSNHPQVKKRSYSERLCSFYYFEEEGQGFFTTMNFDFKFPYKNKDDYIRFEGHYSHYSLEKSYNPYAKNEREHTLWNEGYEYYEKNKPKKRKKKLLDQS